jgi:hypothetical protein
VEPGYVAALATARPFRVLRHFTPRARPDRRDPAKSLNEIGGSRL